MGRKSKITKKKLENLMSKGLYNYQIAKKTGISECMVGYYQDKYKLEPNRATKFIDASEREEIKENERKRHSQYIRRRVGIGRQLKHVVKLSESDERILNMVVVAEDKYKITVKYDLGYMESFCKTDFINFVRTKRILV